MVDRAAEVLWVLDHLRDLDADFLRFYRLDIRQVDGPRLLALAHRVAAFGGVMTMRVGEAQDGATSAAPRSDDGGVRWVPDTLLHLDSMLGAAVERVTV